MALLTADGVLVLVAEQHRWLNLNSRIPVIQEAATSHDSDGRNAEFDDERNNKYSVPSAMC